MADHAHSTTASTIPIGASATALPISSRRLFLAAGTAAAVFAGLRGAAHAAPSPILSEDLRAAIAEHKAVQATIDGMSSEDEDAWNAALDAEDKARWALAETPCQSDADFFEKVAYLLAHEYRLQGGMYTHAVAFGDLAFAIELHLEQKGMSAAELANV